MITITHDFKQDGVQNVCDFCGNLVPAVEPESACAELTPSGKLACWTCQNHNPQAQTELSC